MIEIIKGNLLQADVDIIGHQVNCQGVMGGGLALQIRNKYPRVYDDYKMFCNNNESKVLMGQCQCVKTNDYVVANLFSQEYYGNYGDFYKKYNRQTSYDALRVSLAVLEYLYPRDKIGLPYGIGCGLAGGDWDIVYDIIDEVFEDNAVYLYKI